MKLSVITPTLNPRKEFLDRVFKALDQQSLSKEEWEYILVDNGSDKPLRDQVDLSWHPNARVVDEEKKGLTPARLRGMDEASGDVVVLVDDDCVLAENYLETAIQVLEEYPHIGALGAYIKGEFEVEPPEWMVPFVIMLCAMQYSPERDAEMQYAMSRRSDSCTPAGAGMVLRKEVVETYSKMVRSDPFRMSLDRTGKDLVGSGDLDIACTAIEMGLATGNTTRLQVLHLIPAGRMEMNYLLRLLYASNFGTARLLVHRGWREPVEPRPKSLRQKVTEFFTSLRKQSPASACWAAFQKGYDDGMTGRPYDKRYSSS